MSSCTIVGFAGNITRPSKTRSFVEDVVGQAAGLFDLSASVFDVTDLGPSFPSARREDDLDEAAKTWLRAIAAADLLVVGSPTYKGSYTGLFKHFFDLLDPAALRGKPVILVATGGGDRHALIVEHQLRPLFGFFEAFALPTAIYAADRDFSNGELVSPGIRQRVSQAIGEAGRALAISAGHEIPIAAE